MCFSWAGRGEVDERHVPAGGRSRWKACCESWGCGGWGVLEGVET